MLSIMTVWRQKNNSSPDPNIPWELQYHYSGYRSTTKSNHTCIPWFELELHWNIPMGDLERNACRRLSGFVTNKPFCYYEAKLGTPQSTWLWEECDIPICGKDCT